jgi:transposase
VTAGYQVIRQLVGHRAGAGQAAIITAEIGDVTQFQNAAQLRSWAG